MRCQNTFLFFLVDSAGQSAYWEDGAVFWSVDPRPLEFSPDGWRDTQVGFTRSSKYFGLNRQLTNSYKFVEDGANIIRYLLYQDMSYESKLYLIVTKWNDQTDVYESYYRGEIDLVKAVDDPDKGITANMIEGDLLKFINANDDIDYEISLEDQVEVEVDAVALANRARYSIIDSVISGSPDNYVLCVFLSVDQQLPGFDYKGHDVAVADPLAYVFYTPRAQDIVISGSIIFKPAASGTYILSWIVKTDSSSTDNFVTSGMAVTGGVTYTLDLAKSISMPENSSLQLAAAHTWSGNSCEYFESNFEISFDFLFPTTVIKAIRPFELFKELLLKMLGDQEHTAVSEFLETTNSNLVVTSGDAIRGIEGAVIKTSFSKFFDSFNKILFAGFGVSGLNAIFEARQYFYPTDTDTLNLGEVSELVVTIAEDQLVNSAKIGYPVQDIEKLNGRYSFNNTNVFNLPVNRVKKEYDQVSQYLTDPYVIENTRINFEGRDTTDNKNDNSVFILNATGDVNPLQLYRPVYDSITGVPATSNVYNIEQLTPKRMLMAHAPYYRALLYFLSTEVIAFKVADRNKDLETVLSAVEVDEDADVEADDLGGPLFYPFIFSFKTRVPSTFINIFNDAVNGHIRFSYNGFTLYGFPVQMNAKPAMNEAQDWKLLASPLVDLAALTDLLANPLNSITMSSYGLSFSKLSPVQFVPLDFSQDARYNSKHMDVWTYYMQSTRYAGYQPYQQKWQTNDTIKLQCITKALSPVQVDVIDKYGRVYDSVTLDGIITSAVTSPYQLFEGDVDLSDLTPGIYWLKVTAGITPSVIFISEPLDIQDEWPKTLLFEYSHTRNQAATIFSTGYDPNIRVEAFISEMSPRARFSQYEDEPANMYMLEGTAYRQFGLYIGDGFGVPPYMADKINRIMTLNSVQIDGKAFVRDDDAQMEPVGRIQGMAGTWWKLSIREGSNYEAITQDSDGEIDPSVVLINVDTALFGDLSSEVSENIVQVELLNP